MVRNLTALMAAIMTLIFSTAAWAGEGAAAATDAAPVHHGGGEANLVVPDLSSVSFFGMPGTSLLMIGLAVCAAGMVFGLVIYMQLKNAPVHKSMLEISELIYETCKTYLVTQMKFILILEAFIGTIIVIYFGAIQHLHDANIIFGGLPENIGEDGSLVAPQPGQFLCDKPLDSHILQADGIEHA